MITTLLAGAVIGAFLAIAIMSTVTVLISRKR